MKLTEGQIFCASWGYDQTNVNWFVVVKATKTMATLQEVAAIETETGSMTGTSRPDPTKPIGEPFRRKIKDYLGEPAFRLESYMFAYPWDGERKYFSTYH